jgi:hypothetical protein
MHDPLLPGDGQAQGPAGPQTIAAGVAESCWHSESTLQGACGTRQVPQPTGVPPGLQKTYPAEDAQSLLL